MNAVTNFILRRAGWVALIGVLLSVAAGYFSVELYKNLRTDIQELLPTDSRSVIDIDEVRRRLESIDNLSVLIDSDDTVASRRFVDDLARELQKAPKDVVASVEYNISKELEFFKRRQALYIDFEDLTRVRDYIRDRISYERRLYNPLNIFSGVDLPEPRLDFMGMQQKYSGKVSSFSSFPGGYYATPDEKQRVVLVYIPSSTGEQGSVYKLKKYVKDTVDRLDPASYSPGMRVRYTGGVQNTIEEQDALMADLGMSSVIVLVLVSLAMWIFFRTLRGTIALCAALIIGTMYTFGISYFVVGYLNANSAFMGSIVIGNGINFGIIFLARYLEERRNDRTYDDALRSAMTYTARATSTAALAAGLSYGSLMLTGFRGFAQFGLIGLIGMTLCWITSFSLLPAFLVLLERWKPILKPGSRAPKAPLSNALAHLVQTRPKLIGILTAALTVVSVMTFAKFDSDTVIESNLAKLRNKESMEKGSGFLSRYVDEIFKRYLSPMVILPRTREEARQIAQILKDKQKAEGEKSLIASVQTIDDFIPQDQTRKIAMIREIEALLPPPIFLKMDKADQKTVREFFTPESKRPIRMEDLPELVLGKFREKDGSIGKLVVVEPPINQETFDRRNLNRFIKSLRDAGDQVSPGAAVAGPLAVSSDMIAAITEDGPKATVFAFAAVVLLVVILFRNFRNVTLVLFSLLLGIIWLVGLMLGLELKINFLNFIALPITFGIGIDYGVNIYERYREEGAGSIVRVVRETGGAVGLCSVSTIIGFGSLLIAQNQAFVSFGLLAVLGELTTLFAAIVSLPAYLLLSDRLRKTKAA